jgi:hypothetical protein
MKCILCADTGWVCENPPDKEGAGACTCGAAGAPCPACNVPEEGSEPRPPEGLKTEVNKDGWRH